MIIQRAGRPAGRSVGPGGVRWEYRASSSIIHGPIIDVISCVKLLAGSVWTVCFAATTPTIQQYQCLSILCSSIHTGIIPTALNGIGERSHSETTETSYLI